jgi:hydroxymethylpyrimidine/phosphomethylpyrimidine kinase
MLARDLLQTGAEAALIKGGHAAGETCRDVLVTRTQAESFEWRRTAGSYHGTGCAFAAAIASLLARGEPLEAAVRRAGAWLQAQIGGAVRPLRGELGLLPFTPERR